MPFHLDQFVLDCLAAREADPSHKLVREVVARAVSDPSGVLRALGVGVPLVQLNLEKLSAYRMIPPLPIRVALAMWEVAPVE